MESKKHGLEITSRRDLERCLAEGMSLAGGVISGLDLRHDGLAELLAGHSFEATVFLGCRFPDTLLTRVRESGGIIFPRFENLPFNPYRTSLYTVAELMEGYVRGRSDSISSTLDARIYDYFRSRNLPGMLSPFLETLACRIHDHAIDRALHELLYPSGEPERRVVGIMGGHKLRRDDPGFLGVARIAHRLTRSGYFVATGGGPGAMEAGNLGAWFSDEADAKLSAAIQVMKVAPLYLDPGYVDRAFDVLDLKPVGDLSVAVPTWFYGHEPSNLFSARIAKYFANSIREDGLLTIATYGIIFSPGSAGTVQEIFQDAAQNHYGTPGVVSPMVFLGVEYWSRYRPVYPLLSAMSEGLPYADMIAVTDDPDEAVRFITDNPPQPQL